jgi:tyrosinase
MRNRSITVSLLLLALTASTLALSSCKNDTTSPATPTLRVRKNVKFLTATEKADFTNAVLKLKTVPSPYDASLSYYDQFVMWHRNSFYCDTMAAHMGPAFLPWHRQFLLMFENALRSVSGKDITLPYWDWTNQASTDAVFADDMMGKDGDPANGYAVMTGPFRKGIWEIKVFDQRASDTFWFPFITRAIGTFPHIATLPTTADVEAALAVPTYDVAPWDVTSSPPASFRNNLEGWRDQDGEDCEDSLMTPLHDTTVTAPHEMHNGVHLWVSGAFGDAVGTMALNTSLNDPVFWLHHCNIDRLWTLWMARHGKNYLPVSGAHHGQNLNDAMWPYSMIGLQVTPASLLDNEKLGYKYGDPIKPD